MRLERKYEAEAAHQLSAGVPDGHPCKRLHGHRYCFTVMLIGDVNPATGMIMEYAEIDAKVQAVLQFVDHRFINLLGQNVRLVDAFSLTIEAIEGAKISEVALAQKVRENSTVENLAKWFIAELRHEFNEPRHVGGMGTQVYAVRIEEDSRSSVEVRL